MTQALFRSAHEALTFAYRYEHHQSQRTPMTSLMPQGQLGSGRGLVGLDGAAQSGMILGALRKLPQTQQQVVAVRYGDIPMVCGCCGNSDGRPAAWLECVDALSHWCTSTHDLHRDVRRALIIKAVCRRGRNIVHESAQRYDVAERTLRRRLTDAKDQLGRVENEAMGWVEWWLREPEEALDGLEPVVAGSAA